MHDNTSASVRAFDPSNHKADTVSHTGVCAWGRVADYRCETEPEFSVSHHDGSDAYAVCSDHLVGATRWLLSREHAR